MSAPPRSAPCPVPPTRQRTPPCPCARASGKMPYAELEDMQPCDMTMEQFEAHSVRAPALLPHRAHGGWVGGCAGVLGARVDARWYARARISVCADIFIALHLAGMWPSRPRCSARPRTSDQGPFSASGGRGGALSVGPPRHIVCKDHKPRPRPCCCVSKNRMFSSTRQPRRCNPGSTTGWIWIAVY